MAGSRPDPAGNLTRLEIETMRTVSNRNSLPWLSRLGVGGFLFFFVKGMMWLALPYLAALFLN